MLKLFQSTEQLYSDVSPDVLADTFDDCTEVSAPRRSQTQMSL